MRRHQIRLTGADYRAQLDLLIAVGAVKVTKCAEFARYNLNPKRGGGHLPAHLNPLTMGDRDDGRA